MTVAEYKAALESLTEEEFASFRRDFGGDLSSRQRYVDDFVYHPQHERRICQLLNLKTEEEKLVEAALASSRAAQLSNSGVFEMPRRDKTDYRMPTLKPERGRLLLEKKIQSGNDLLKVRYDDVQITEWENLVQNLLAQIFGDPSDNVQAFRREGTSVTYFGMPDSEYQQQWIARQKARLAILRSAVEQLSWQEEPPSGQPEAYMDKKTAFLVHGRNDAAKETVARFLGKLGLNVTILHEEADAGRTIIEKFEHHSRVPFAVILATADDIGYANGEPTAARSRARQNVLLEMGYFLGKLGRKNVFPLVEEGVEMPSDYSGVLHIPFKNDGSWRTRLAREMHTAGADIDLSKAV